MTDTPETRADRVLELLVKAAVKLAIMRHDLQLEDGELEDRDVDEIAANTWNALNGIDTCCDEPATELSAVREAIAEARAEQLIEDANLIDEFERPGRIASRMMRDKADRIRAGGKP